MQVHAGEVDALVAERVWQELNAHFGEQRLRPFEALRLLRRSPCCFPRSTACSVPQPAGYHPEIDTGIHTMMVLEAAARLSADTTVRFAALTHDLGKGTTPKEEWPRHIAHEQRSVGLVEALCQRLRAPNEHRELALITARYHGDCHRALELRPDTVLRMLDALDAFRRPQRFEQFLLACTRTAAVARFRGG